MVYPVFEYESIKARCAQDIAQFIKETKAAEEKNKRKTIDLDDTTGLSLYIPKGSNITKDELTRNVEPILSFFKKHLGDESYIKKISKMEPDIQYQLWIARTYLFYQLLIYATATFLDEALYNTVYIDRDKFPYMPALKKETLADFKMGIFGSMTPTSDIDIGIQYSGMTKIVALAHIVSRFECLFLIFTGKDSLAYDIETYADMMTLPQKGGADYFYLDSSDFGPKEFTRMLPCAGASIIRNIVLTKEPVTPFIGTFNDIVTNSTFSQIVANRPNMLDNFSKDAVTLLQNPEWFSEATVMVNEFMALDTEGRRYAYYEKVKDAENLLFTYIPDRENIRYLDNTVICDIMVKIGEALVYRMESYTCAPTVIHVVRILQASKNNPLKYKNATPQQLCNGTLRKLEPYCTIGSYGYMLSMLEQIGYAYRFYLTYCISNHKNEAKCTKKIDKYKGRYINAIEFLQKRLKASKTAVILSAPIKKLRSLRPSPSLRRLPSTPIIRKQLSMVGGYPKKKSKQTKKKCMSKLRYTRSTRKSSAKTHSKSK